MNPLEFEELVRNYFRQQGYEAETTPYNDYGVDVFAVKGKEKIAIQVKMYGGSTRKINRQMVMELYGAKAYFDCTQAVIATNGQTMKDAMEVASKLGINVLSLGHLAACTPPTNKTQIKKAKSKELTFEAIWERYVFPLEGKTLAKPNGKNNKIVRVDWSGIERLTSNNNRGKIKIEIFKLTVNRLLDKGFITRDEINQNYQGRASSGVVLILSQVPFFKKTSNPLGLKYEKNSTFAKLKPMVPL